MANTFTKIASVTVGSGGASSIDFTSIPSTYTDLCVKISARGSTTFALNGHFYAITLNNTSANRSQRFLQGDGATPASGTSSSFTSYMDPSDYTANTFANNEMYIPNYAGSTNKSMSLDVVTENNSTTSFAAFYAQLWSDTAAINRVTLTPNAGNFAQYSTATLYGIKNS
jgi:hypothetical protein